MICISLWASFWHHLLMFPRDLCLYNLLDLFFVISIKIRPTRGLLFCIFWHPFSILFPPCSARVSLMVHWFVLDCSEYLFGTILASKALPSGTRKAPTDYRRHPPSTKEKSFLGPERNVPVGNLDKYLPYKQSIFS